MPVVGITGGIATGKTLFTATLQRALHSAEVFDSDACARKLPTSNATVHAAIRERFGDEVFTPNGELNRARLRDVIFHDDAGRRALEEILHPVIRETWLRRAAEALRSKEWLLVDIPLLYETGAEPFFDSVIVVACANHVQWHRLLHERRLPEAVARRILAVQMPLGAKIERADHVVWSDGVPPALEMQTILLRDHLVMRHG